MTGECVGNLFLRAIAAIVLGLFDTGVLAAAHNSVETGPRSKVTIIASGAEIAFFIGDRSDPCSDKRRSTLFKVKRKTGTDSTWIVAGQPTNFGLWLRAPGMHTVTRDFSFTPLDGYEYSFAYRPATTADRFDFEFRQLAPDGTESRLVVDYMRQCGESYDRTYPAEPSTIVQVGTEPGDNDAIVRFVAPGLRGRFLSVTGIKLWVFEDPACEVSRVLKLNPDDRHQVFRVPANLAWNFRLFYDQWEFNGGRQQTFADFSFAPLPAAEYLIEYIDNPIEAEINFAALDEAGNRTVLATSASTCP
jgi:hypothetical protein